MAIEKNGAGMKGIKTLLELIEKRECYRRELARCVDLNFHGDKYLIKVYQRLLGHVERQIENKKK